MDSDDEEDKPKDVVRANEDMVGGVDDDNKKMGSVGWMWRVRRSV